MSSPIHLDGNADPQLIYAPRGARERVVPIVHYSLEVTGRPARRISAKSTSRFSGDRAILHLRDQLALDPDLIPEPALEADAIMRPLLMRLCSVSALAAFVAWGLVSYSDVKKATGIIPANTSVQAMAGDHDVVAVPALPSRSTMSQGGEALPSLGKSASTVVATAGPAAVVPATTPAPRAAGVDSARLTPRPPQHGNNRQLLQLDSDEVASLVKRGQDLVASGDLAAARLLLRRAAEADSAEAALTLGTTYDPVVLQRLGAIGAPSDPTQARQWYQRAAELGSTAASQQLAGLGGPH